MKDNLFNGIITSNDFYIGMPDCISSALDYKQIIEEAFKLTNGLLTINKFEGKNTIEKYSFVINVNGEDCEFDLDVISDYVDTTNLFPALNSILDKVNYNGPNRFYSLYGNVLDFGIGFIPKEKYKELVNSNLVVE
ncbi:MAG: hypothetical protein AAGG75_12630 [Bacteroidota bacterium]